MPHAKKTRLKPWLKQEWCLPTVSAECVWRMDEVLDLYAEPDDVQYPVVCFDASPYPLLSEVRQPVPVAPGQPGRYAYEYRREGPCHLCMCVQPLGGWRHVKGADRHTDQDFAPCMKELVDSHFPQATRMSVVLDHLNTHTPAALDETFAPAEARRMLQTWDVCYTPKHSSWLNMAEIALAARSLQCLNRRLPDQATVRRRIGAWEAHRNADKATINWRFTTAKARRQLKRLYPL